MEHCWINQNAKLSLGLFDAGQKTTYFFNPTNKCLLIFGIKGSLTISGNKLPQPDAIGIWDTNQVDIVCDEDCEFLVIETPINQK